MRPLASLRKLVDGSGEVSGNVTVEAVQILKISTRAHQGVKFLDCLKRYLSKLLRVGTLG